MEGWVKQMAQFLNLWVIRIAVLSSLAAHLVIILLAGIRRRKSSGVWTRLLWLAYQLADRAAPYALGHLSVGSTSQEQQLVAFWAPFLLQHLGGPDNISAYSLEDNVLFRREALSVITRGIAAAYVLYKHIYIGSGALLPASIIIFAVGIAKYVERVFALWRGDLGNIRISSSGKEEQPSRFFTDRWGSLIRMGNHQLDDEQALMVAHNMFPFCHRAMTDSSVHMGTPELGTGQKIFSVDFGWENMCKVVEMELSLMYDILFTKAAMVHTWGGYLIRLVSPVATAAAFLLFLSYSKDGQRTADLIITYALLAAAFVLDIRWLLRALGSTWTHAFLQARPWCWLHHAVLCNGRWRWFRGVVVSLDLGRLVFLMTPSCYSNRKWTTSSYRRWSGTVGQYSLLHECTRDTTCLPSRLAKKIGLAGESTDHKLSQDVKRLVFERVREVLRSTYEDADVDYSMDDITKFWGQETYRKSDLKKEKKFYLSFGHEFQEDILVWHIATQVFLSRSGSHGKNAAGGHAMAIKALSEYLMFLVAVRPHMLPGLVLRSLNEVTHDALQAIWRDEASAMSRRCSTTTCGEERLARILCDMIKDEKTRRAWRDREETRLFLDGTNIAMTLLDANQSEMPELLELVFNMWVDKLLYAGTRCSRESHAKQLGRGGELTTIVWIMAEHAGLFQIGQPRPGDRKSADKKPEEKKPDEKLSPPTFAGVPPRYPPAYPPQALPQPMYGDGSPMYPQAPPTYPFPPMYPPASDEPQMYPPAFGEPDHAKPKARRGWTPTYVTLYPVD